MEKTRVRASSSSIVLREEKNRTSSRKIKNGFKCSSYPKENIRDMSFLACR
jgi:hypothetical protein